MNGMEFLNILFFFNSGTTMNIWYTTGENIWASNLYHRSFIYKGRVYISVEHAYQTLKSGDFDIKTYLAKWKCGRKIVGRFPPDKKNNRELMKTLMRCSFEQNLKILKRLILTGDINITHHQGDPYWREEFPKILMELRTDFQTNFAITGEVEGIDKTFDLRVR